MEGGEEDKGKREVLSFMFILGGARSRPKIASPTGKVSPIGCVGG